jgi:hypothetical protein
MEPTILPYRVCSSVGAEHAILALFLNRRLAYRFRDILWSD